jgi:cytochrome c biogenesis protein CcmG, thiol:disulfide interchange protein DsbE
MWRVKPPRSSWGIRAGVLLPVAALLAILAWGTVRHERSTAVGAALARGQTPPLPAATLLRFDGQSVALADLRGHPLVLNFWASWCVPCAEEAPILEGISREFYPRGLIVVGIDTQDLEQPGRRFMAAHGITYLNVRDPDGAVGRTFGTTGVPETFFVSADGLIRGKFPGEQVDLGAWREAVKALLAGHPHVP